MVRKQTQLKRHLAQAYIHQMRTIEILLQVATVFGEWHSDYAELFQLIATNCYITMQAIKDVCIHSWGTFPDNIKSWLK